MTPAHAAIGSRVPFVVLAAITVPCGLAVRNTTLPLPALLKTEGGDLLYATLV